MMMWKEKKFTEWIPEGPSYPAIETGEYRLWVRKQPTGATGHDKIKWIDVPEAHEFVMEKLMCISIGVSSPVAVSNALGGTEIIPTLMWLHKKREHMFSYYQSKGKIRVRMAASPSEYLNPHWYCRGIASSLRKHSRWVNVGFNDEWIRNYKKISPLVRYNKIQSHDKTAFETLATTMILLDASIERTSKESVLNYINKQISSIVASFTFSLESGHTGGYHVYGKQIKNEIPKAEHVINEFEFNIFPHGPELKMEMIEKIQKWEDHKNEVQTLVNECLGKALSDILEELEKIVEVEE